MDRSKFAAIILLCMKQVKQNEYDYLNLYSYLYDYLSGYEVYNNKQLTYRENNTSCYLKCVTA